MEMQRPRGRRVPGAVSRDSGREEVRELTEYISPIRRANSPIGCCVDDVDEGAVPDAQEALDTAEVEPACWAETDTLSRRTWLWLCFLPWVRTLVQQHQNVQE